MIVTENELPKEVILDAELLVLCCRAIIPWGSLITIVRFNSPRRVIIKCKLKEHCCEGYHKVKLSKIIG